jgi:alkylation response protein AidB-like acyl-CoA dehydrogenase
MSDGGMTAASAAPSPAEFRSQVRKWLAAHAPERPALDDTAGRIAWQGQLGAAGLIGVDWPTEYGGRGLSPEHAHIAVEELDRADAPGPFDVIGVEIFAPTFLRAASATQQARYLPAMLGGSEIWCQLYSEPGAGSDLAGVTTRAKRTPDGTWVITGQKVWTTNAQLADFGLALVRTDREVPKHRGLTLFIIPMRSPGVTVRGLRQISGEAEFNEVFLDEVEVGPENMVGEVGGGWKIALTSLAFERMSMGLGGEGKNLRASRFARALAGLPGITDQPEVMRSLGEVGADLLAVSLAGARAMGQLRRGLAPSPAIGLAKVTLVRAAMAGCDLVAEALGPDALDEPLSPWAYSISFLPGLRSAGGTEEIIKNTVGDRVLGLPPEPRIDKDIPFSEIPA